MKVCACDGKPFVPCIKQRLCVAFWKRVRADRASELGTLGERGENARAGAGARARRREGGNMASRRRHRVDKGTIAHAL